MGYQGFPVLKYCFREYDSKNEINSVESGSVTESKVKRHEKCRCRTQKELPGKFLSENF